MTTTPTVLTSHNGADFLAMLPTLAGFEPHDSVLVVPFHGRRTMGVMRMDLPHGADDAATDRFCAVAVGAISRLRSCDGVVIVLYTDETFAVAFSAWEALADRLQERFTAAGFAVKDALCAAADGWASWQDPDVPWDGRPLHEITASPLAAQAATARSGRPLPEQSTDALLPDADPVPAARLSDAVRLRLVAGGECDSFGVYTEVAQPSAVGVARRLHRCTDPAGMSLALMTDTAVLGASGTEGARLMIAMVFGAKLARRASSAQIDAIFLGAHRGPVDVPAVRRGILLLRHVTAHLDRPLQPGMLCMLGWLHWACGAGTQAGRYADEALRVDRGNPTATILRTLVGGGTLPDWVYDEHDRHARRATSA